MKTNIIPPDVTLRTDQEKRMPPDKMKVFIDALVDPNHKMAFTIHHLGSVKGFSRKFIEITVKNANGMYYMVFGLKDDDYVRQLWIVVGPSGGGYSIDKDGPMIVDGKPQEFLPKETCDKLSDMLIKTQIVREVVVNTYYKVEFKEGDKVFAAGAMFDKGSGGKKGISFPRALATYNAMFTDEKEAKKVAEQLIEYLEDQKTAKHKSIVHKNESNTK